MFSFPFETTDDADANLVMIKFPAVNGSLSGGPCKVKGGTYTTSGCRVTSEEGAPARTDVDGIYMINGHNYTVRGNKVD